MFWSYPVPRPPPSQGKLKIIASMKNLQHLDLSGTEVAGDIQALQEVQKLQHINLHSTRVAGAAANRPLKDLRMFGIVLYIYIYMYVLHMQDSYYMP